MEMYDRDFVFHLYCAFQDRDQAIGLELIEALESINQKLGLSNFKAIIRLSITAGPKLPRWTPSYLEEQLTPLAGKIKRIWVCGPPSLNQTCDQALAKLTATLQLTPDQIEIL